MFTAVLDTCVLWPSLQRDFLLSLAIEGMYRPVWNAVMLVELQYCEKAKLIRRGESDEEAGRRSCRLIEQMRAAFHDSEIHGWEGLDGTYDLPDLDDEHVVATAVVAGAGAIVTHNVKHFPEDRLPRGIQVLQPQEFAANTVALDPFRARSAIRAIAYRSGRRGPVLTEAEVIEALARRYQMAEVVTLLRVTDS